MNQNYLKIISIINDLLIINILIINAFGLSVIGENCVLSNGELGKCAPIYECDEKQTDLIQCGEDLNLGVCCYNITRNVGEISKQKCNEVYSERYKYIVTEKIIGGGGYRAIADEFPHMVALGYGEWKNVNWACGGSLISEKFVLTAAHCIHTPLGPLKYLRVGALNLQHEEDGVVILDYNVTKTYVHPGFKPPSHYNDIALVELDQPLQSWTLYRNIAPACLHTERNITSTNWNAIGWGETSYNGPKADHLQVMELREAEFELCKAAFNSSSTTKLLKGIDDESQICAGHGKIDTCQGDSGGPLQFRNRRYRTGYTVIGITSFGKACVLTNKPGVYTRVSHYIEWIESIVWPL